MKYFFKFSLILILSVFMITSLKAQNALEKGQNKPTNNFNITGLFNTTNVGILLGSSQNNQKAPFSLISITGYHINDKLAVGLGVGVDFWEETYIPLVADIRYYFRNTSFSPFIFLQAGYSISIEDRVSYQTYDKFNGLWSIPNFNIDKINSKGGLLVNPGFGLRKMLGKNFGLIFSISYRYQKLMYEATPENKLEVEYNRINLRFGIIFK